MRKPVFGVCDQMRLKPAYSATETSQNLDILDSARIWFILPRQRTTKALTSCSYMTKDRFSHDVAQFSHFKKGYNLNLF